MIGFRKRICFDVALRASMCSLIYSNVVYSVDFNETFLADAQPSVQENLAETGHQVNFNNISIIELIRFVSKITNLNFIFEEGDLQFAVTLVSEEPISSQNIMSALAQILRVHQMNLLEQDNNVLIVRQGANVNQIPTIVSGDLPESAAGNAALVTRVFRIKNANINSIASVIRPMTSLGALVEISNETRQLIVTDITTNVDKIADLLTSLDAPHTPLDMESYACQNISPAELIVLTQMIISPFSEGNPVIFVPQADTNTIFIVSTPYLIERAIIIMEDLDIPPKETKIGQREALEKHVYIYQAINRTPDQLVSGLDQIEGQLSAAGPGNAALQDAINGVKVVENSSSLMFLVDEETKVRLQDLLSSLDTQAAPSSAKTSIYIYKIQSANEEQIELSLNQTANQIERTANPDQDLIDAINSMRWIKETNSLVFTGTDGALSYLKTILPTFDVSPSHSKAELTQAEAKSHFLLYSPQYLAGPDIQKQMEGIISNLRESGLADPSMLQALDSMKWESSSNTLIFTGDPKSLDKIRTIISNIDVQGTYAKGTQGAKGFYLYKLENNKGDTVIHELDALSTKIPLDTIKNQNVVDAIKKVEWVKSTNSLLITGQADAIEEIKTLIAEFDVPTGASTMGLKSNFIIYKPQYISALQLQGALKDTSQDLIDSGLSDPEMMQALTSMRYVAATDSIIFTGSPSALDKVKSLVAHIDSPGGAAAIQHIGKTTFIIYKIEYVTPDQLIASLKNFALQLPATTPIDKELIQSINTLRFIKETNSLLFTGSDETLERVGLLVQKFDNAALAPQEASVRAPSTYVIYNPRYLTGDDLIQVLSDFEQNLIHAGIRDEGLFDSINNLKWIDQTNSLLISGDADSIDKVQDLLKRFDVPGKESMATIESIDDVSFLVYKLQYHAGSDIQVALRQIAGNLKKSPNTTSTDTVSSDALTSAVESVQWIEVTNSLLASGQPDVLVKLKDLIENLDVPLKQVFIEVLVINTTLTNAQQIGLSWGGHAQFLNKFAAGTGNFPSSATGSSGLAPAGFATGLSALNATTTPTGGGSSPAVPFASAFDLGVVGDIIMNKGRSFISLGSLITALQTDATSTIVMNPKIIAQDNKQSNLFVGSNLPFTGATVTTVGANTQTTGNIEYRDIGVSLTITPILGDNDIVSLTITYDQTAEIGNTTNTTTLQLNGIPTSHTHMDTQVHVPNEHFVCLSGMIADNKNNFRTGIPCLGGLPVIGLLFSENDRSDAKSNIVIFMRPQIIKSYADYKKVTEHQEWLFKDQARVRVLKEQFDEGIDMVKTPENE